MSLLSGGHGVHRYRFRLVALDVETLGLRAAVEVAGLFER